MAFQTRIFGIQERKAVDTGIVIISFFFFLLHCYYGSNIVQTALGTGG